MGGRKTKSQQRHMGKDSFNIKQEPPTLKPKTGTGTNTIVLKKK